MTHPVLLPGKVAVITGGASGIGLAAAKRFVCLGMKVCIADLNPESLASAANELASLSPDRHDDILTFACDVADMTQVESLKRAVYTRFGQVDLLMNNAGIGARAGSFDGYDNWQKTLNTNLWGVIHGVQIFTQAMLDQKTPAMIINTGSKQGITTPPGNTAYNVSKAGVKALTEGLQHSLRNEPDSQVSAHLLIPGFVYSGMMNKIIPEQPAAAWTCEQTIDYMMEKLARGDFYIICPDNEVTFEMDQKRMLWAAGDIAFNRPALSRWHPDYEQRFAAYMQKPVTEQD